MRRGEMVATRGADDAVDFEILTYDTDKVHAVSKALPYGPAFMFPRAAPATLTTTATIA